MHLHFDTLQEFHDMAEAMGYVRANVIGTQLVDIRMSATDIEDVVRRVATEHTCEAHVTALPPIPGDEQDAHSDEGFTGTEVGDALRELPTPVQAGAEPVKRKRRTKAEIEADKAAQELPSDPPKTDPLANLQPEPVAPTLSDKTDALQAITEMAGVYDGNDKLAHLNEAREFIAKHGFLTYNETMQLADVPSNIATHTPEQVSRHRAAMAWRAAQ